MHHVNNANKNNCRFYHTYNIILHANMKISRHSCRSKQYGHAKIMHKLDIEDIWAHLSFVVCQLEKESFCHQSMLLNLYCTEVHIITLVVSLVLDTNHYT